MHFTDRYAAGRILAPLLSKHQGQKNLIVLGLPRGGIPVAYEVALALKAPLDVLVVRKIGLPQFPEFAIGAIASGGVEILSKEIPHRKKILPKTVREVLERERETLSRQEQRFGGRRPLPCLKKQTVILVDDGLATGYTMEAAVAAVRKHEAGTVVVAVPVGSFDACQKLKSLADEVVCGYVPGNFEAVGNWYDDFRQTTDDEVELLLRKKNS
ncbi:MAG: phosphoribosyltransferase [Methylacidiphilales bacterium]|nr:phosphoribosyltransferase [Candidatus Methylacidiphilales bacterium]